MGALMRLSSPGGFWGTWSSWAPGRGDLSCESGQQGAGAE